jgi:Flp pilus assembly protein TadD
MKRRRAGAPRIVIGNFRAQVEQGLEHLEGGRFQQAELAFRSALAMNPRDDQLLHLVGVAQLRQGRVEDAVASTRRAISLTKRKADYHNTLGCALHQIGQVDEAIACFRRALNLVPDFAKARFNCGQALLQARRYAEARTLFGNVVSADPGDVEALIGLARADWIAGEHAAAVEILRESVARLPANRFLRFVLSELLLALGKFEAGWREYMERPNRSQLLARAGRGSDRAGDLAMLPQSLEGRTVKLMGEQGLGDQLFFLRFVSVIRERGVARVEVAIEPRLVDMVKRTGIVDECVDATPELLRDPRRILIGDLPYLLGSDASSLPAPLSLTPLPDRMAAIGRRLEGLPRPIIGLSWRAGTPPGAGDSLSLFKDLPFERFADFASRLPGTLVVLQRHPRPAELELLSSRASGRMLDLSSFNDDLEDMLAVLAGTDEYIGVSNTNTHLYAGVGRRGRVLVTSDVEFRWMATGPRSPWFPGFEVYRPGPERDWPRVFEELLKNSTTTLKND